MKLDKNTTYIIVAVVLSLGILGSVFLNSYLKTKREQENLVMQELLEDDRFQKEEQAEARRHSDIEFCIANVSATAASAWSRECKRIGLPDDCLLPANVADVLNDSSSEAKNRCERVYK